MNTNIQGKMNNIQLTMLLEKVKELSKLNTSKEDNVTVVIDNYNILLYSYVGKNISDITAFKNFIQSTTDFIQFKKPLKDTISLIIKDSKKFVRNLQNLLSYDNDIDITIIVDNDNNFINSIIFNNSKLKIRVIGGDPVILSGDISVDTINSITDTSLSQFQFKIDSIDFDMIKKMSLIDSSNDVMTIKIENGLVTIGESKWDLDIDKSHIIFNRTLTFNKKYFNSISTKKFILVNVFENHILLNTEESNLMIILEFSI